MTGATRRLSVAGAVLDGAVVPGDVAVADGRIVEIGLMSTGAGVAVPGFVDLQVNGFGGVDFLDAEPPDFRVAGHALLETGVTAYQPTFITAPAETVEHAVAVMEQARDADDGPRILGAHLEGPFLSPARAGTHPVEHLRGVDAQEFAPILRSSAVTTVTLAPELPGAVGLVRRLAGRGVRVWLGHSDADAAQAHRAFDAGACGVTHLFNAMRPFVPRDPGLVGACLAREDVHVGMIVDGVHLADETVILAWRAATGRALLVTDAIAAAGRGDGSWLLGSVEVQVEGGEARRADGTLAGSVLTMDQAVRNLVALGVPLAAAIDAATRLPARRAGRDDLGTLAVGATADVVVLDDDLQVVRVLRAGQDVV